MVDTDAKRAAGRGLAGGIAAWILGYLVVYLLHGSSIQNSFGSDVLEVFTGEPVAWKLVGWLFYNAHNVAVQISLFGQRSVNLVAGAEEAALTALFALPPVLLVLAGAVAAWNTAADPTTAARNGAAVALGYLPLSLAGAVLFAIGSGDGASAGPALVTAVLLAGLVYPLVFGAVGGLAGGHLSAD
ncbi:transporter [Halosimplex pelagicum]|uniref:Transporter n=1 Tax=Halosimplex pelagicum TaxID=869886 RepID=A0A7D5P9K1_9EURY|nr:transporter [Halosimplex pelagicum]QLH82701.1 transporter [Halosimplex pelagicum]